MDLLVYLRGTAYLSHKQTLIFDVFTLRSFLLNLLFFFIEPPDPTDLPDHYFLNLLILTY